MVDNASDDLEDRNEDDQDSSQLLSAQSSSVDPQLQMQVALEHDLNQILAEPATLDDDKLQKLLEKQRVKTTTTDQQKAPYWRDYGRSLRLLAGQGVPAIKFNYSNDRSRPVLLKCSEDGQTLIYSDPAEKRNLISRALGIGVKKRALSDYTGIIYGGATSTFERQKAALMSKLEEQ